MGPMRIPGRWIEGYALDYHTSSSVYLGDNEYGHPVWETQRTSLGDLLYRLKYRADTSAVSALADAMHTFLKDRRWEASIIVPSHPPGHHDDFSRCACYQTN